MKKEKFSFLNYTSGCCLGMGGEMWITKRYKETLGGNGCVYDLICADAFIDICIHMSKLIELHFKNA